MAALDWSQGQAVESISGKVSGARVIEQFDVTREQIEAVSSSWPRVCAPTFPPVLVLFDQARRRAWRERCPFTRCTRRSPGAGTG